MSRKKMEMVLLQFKYGIALFFIGAIGLFLVCVTGYVLGGLLDVRAFSGWKITSLHQLVGVGVVVGILAVFGFVIDMFVFLRSRL